MNIKFKILAGFFIILLPIYIINFYFLFQSSKNLENAIYLKENSLPNYILLGKLKSSVQDVTKWLTNVGATRSAKGHIDGYENAEVAYNHSIEYINKLIENYSILDKETKNLYKIHEQISTFYEIGKEMAYAYRDGGTDAGNEMMSVFFQVSKEFQESITILEKEIEASHEDTVKEMESKLNASRIIIAVLSTSFIVLSISISIFTANFIVRPIRLLINVIQEIQFKQDLSLKVHIGGKDEMSSLASQFNFMMDKLFKNETELRQTRDELWGEMELAKKIQTCLVPKIPVVTNCEVVCYMKTADMVGGDYYDVIHILNTIDKDWIVIGDVSGHGVPAGLVMMMVQSLLHGILNTGLFHTPSQVLIEINKTITANIQRLSEDKYMTITLLSMDKEGNMEYAGAHLDILIYRQKKDEIEAIPTNGFWLGIEDDISPFLVDNKTKLNEGDMLMLYTDGLSESRDKDRNMLTVEGIKTILYNNHLKNIQEIKNSFLESTREYQSNDDISFMIIRKMGEILNANDKV